MTKTARTALLLFALGLSVRLFVGAWTWDGFRPTAVEDERGYVFIAQSLAGKRVYDDGREFDRDREFVLAEGHGLRSPGRSVEVAAPRSFRGPVVPLLFEPVAAAGGGVGWMRLVSTFFGSLGAPLLFLALRNSSLGDRAWWPAAAYALWPPAIYVSVRALSEAPSQALLLGAMATLCLQRTKGGVLGGALAALSVLARPAALFPAGMLVFATGSRRRALGFLVAFMVVLAPWEIRNWRLHGRPLLTTNSGVTLVGGNSQAALDAPHPGKWAPPEKVYAGASDPPDLGMWGWSKLSEEASDRRFASDALKWVGDHPADAARLEFWKLVRLFDPDQHSEKDDAGAKAIVGWLTVGPVLALALIGFYTASRSEAACMILVIGTIATALLFYGDTRMRTCADPALLVLAAHGVTRVAGRFARRGLH